MNLYLLVPQCYTHSHKDISILSSPWGKGHPAMKAPPTHFFKRAKIITEYWWANERGFCLSHTPGIFILPDLGRLSGLSARRDRTTWMASTPAKESGMWLQPYQLWFNRLNMSSRYYVSSACWMLQRIHIWRGQPTPSRLFQETRQDNPSAHMSTTPGRSWGGHGREAETKRARLTGGHRDDRAPMTTSRVGEDWDLERQKGRTVLLA